MPRSQNGYSANDINRTHYKRIPGTDRSVRLRKGNTGWLLRNFAAWFDKNIEDIEGGIYDDWGYAERPIRGSSTTLSNHASGTALDLNATQHPLGVYNTFTPVEQRKIRRRLAVYGGAIRWGGDYSGRPDDMHFEINEGVSGVRAAVARIKAGAADVADKVADRFSLVIDLTNVQRQARRDVPTKNLGVKRIQKLLKQSRNGGHKIKADGYWGPNTGDAWLAYERDEMHIENPNRVPHAHSLRHILQHTRYKFRK